MDGSKVLTDEIGDIEKKKGRYDESTILSGVKQELVPRGCAHP